MIAPSLLRLEGAGFTEPGEGTVQPLDLEVQPGELVVVEGPSGSGKTLLARGCLGFVAPASGAVSLFGASLVGRAHDELMALRRRAALSSSALPLLSNQTLHDNLAMPLVMRGTAPDETRETVRDVLERFGISELANARPDDVKQRHRELALAARALVLPVELLVLDDPSLPPPARALLRDRRLAGVGVLVTVRFAAHFPEADRVITLTG